MREPLFVGAGVARESSELVPPSGPPVQPDFVRRLARTHEEAGFDAVLVGTSSTSPDALLVAAEILQASSELGAVVTVAPALVAPTAAARALATLDARYPGRVAAHLPAVHSDRDAMRDGAPGDRAARQRQRAEFADVLTRTWTSAQPFSYTGEFHRVEGAWSAIRPEAPLPLWISGASPASARLAARHGAVHLSAADSVRTSLPHIGVRRGIRLRPIVAASRAGAADYAERVLRVYSGTAGTPARALRDATGAVAGHGSLVGTAADVAATLLGYLGLGIDVFHLAGWRPLADAQHYGEVIAAVHAALAITPSERTSA